MTPPAANHATHAFRKHRWWERHGPWEAVSATYVPPRAIEIGRGASTAALGLVERAMQGVTTVTMRCLTCGDITTRDYLGKVEPPVADFGGAA